MDQGTTEFNAGETHVAKLYKSISVLSDCPEPSKPGRRSFQTLLYNAILLLVLMMATASFCLVLVLYAKCNRLEGQLLQNQALPLTGPGSDDREICFPCSELSQGPFEEDNPKLHELIRQQKDGVMTCCARTQKQTSLMFDLFYQRKMQGHCAQELLTGSNATSCNTSSPEAAMTPDHTASPVSAHLLVGPQSRRRKRYAYDTSTPIRNWETEDPVANLQGIQLHNNRVTIPETGLYFVYSQMHFFIGYDVTSQDSIALFQYVYRFNRIYPNDGNQLLMKSGRTQWRAQTQTHGHYTSYVGAAVKLVQGDELYVSITNADLLERTDRKSSFFGLYKIV